MSLQARREALRELMDRLGLGALLMRRPANFAWYTGGADNRVDHADPLGVATILLTLEGEYVLTDNIEAPRMREEEAPGFEVVEHHWHQDPAGALRALIGDSPPGADFPVGYAREVSEEISPLRYVLDADAIGRFRRLGADAVEALSETAVSLEPRTSEHETAANLADALADCHRFYAEEGFPDGWRDHHQGGLTGYASREIIATPQTRQEMEVGQAFAWNPSLRGSKAEETFVLMENGPEAIARPV